MTLFMAAWDERVAAAVVSGYFSSWAETHKMPWNMCGSQVLPGMLGRLEHVDLGALIAPRPLLIETGTEDPLFPVAAATESVRARGWSTSTTGAGDRLVHDVFEGGPPVARRGRRPSSTTGSRTPRPAGSEAASP